MLGHQRHHDHGERAGCAGDHARTSAEDCGHQAHNESRIKTDQRIDAGNEGERYSFRHKRQRHGQARQNFGFQPLRVLQGQARIIIRQGQAIDERIQGGFDHDGSSA